MTGEQLFVALNRQLSQTVVSGVLRLRRGQNMVRYRQANGVARP